MDGPRDYHTKWNKSDREKQILCDIISGIFKKWYRELIYKTETKRLWKQTYSYQSGNSVGEKIKSLESIHTHCYV